MFKHISEYILNTLLPLWLFAPVLATDACPFRLARVKILSPVQDAGGSEEVEGTCVNELQACRARPTDSDRGI